MPKYELVKDASFTKTDFGDHILLPSTDQDDSFTSLTKHVAILLEETFYNSKDESYRVLCVSEVFNRAVETGVRAVTIRRERTAVYRGTATLYRGKIMPSLLGEGFHLQETVTQMIGLCKHVLRNKVKGQQVIGSAKTKENLDQLLLTFCIDYQKFSGSVTPALVDLVSGQVTRAMQLDSLVVIIYVYNTGTTSY
ncbi:hypothetical protein DPMN_172280 [Dreissena polymorpha]|uniref:Uncharacterized protein n=1 Tax=Dreissena polymorpha TaxID=45954 RepID=A0A9D4E210_DREPO|nr:hypothetical protein DPMN_172280 [Dreissena polymorpha]